MAFASPMSRGNFHYNGDLYVEVGNCNRHRRATVNEITAILRPDLKKSTKATSDAQKDQVGHWYEAQLIHYGLPPSKDKARAKMRLLEALNSSKLSVPSSIAKMEAEMKKEYSAADKKAKAQYKASQAPAKKTETPAGPAPSRKRKQTDTSGNVNNINVSIDMGGDLQGFPRSFDASPGQSPAKKSKPATSKSGSKEIKAIQSSKTGQKTPIAGSDSSPAQEQRPRQTAKSARLTEAWLKDPTKGPGPVNRAALGYPTTSSSGFSLQQDYPPFPSDPYGEGQTFTAAKEPMIKNSIKVKGGVPVKKEPSTKKEPKPKKEVGVKKESSVKREPNVIRAPAPNVPSLGLINGIYDLSCPNIEEHWPCRDLTLTLSLDGTTVWGAYDLDVFSGVLFIASRPWQASNDPLPFAWRGRENGEGEMEFGDHCQGVISFLGNGNIEGCISVYGQCNFTGVRRPQAGAAVRTARSMREEWEGYNEDAYERERVGRWH